MHKISLKRKLIALIVAAIGCAQALLVGVTLWQEASRYAKTKKDTLLADAHVLASAVSRPAAARDRTTIYAALRAIGSIPDLTYVGVEDATGNLLAELGAAEILTSDLAVDDGAAPLPIAKLFTTRSIILRVPIVDGGLQVGHLVLVSDASDLKTRLRSSLKISALALFGSLLIAIMVAWRMQRSITHPLETLTSAMQSVAVQHDYSLALRSSGVREVAILVDGFNAMLGEIRERDGRIAKSYADLERQVLERTADLRVAKDAAESANAQKSDFLATMSHEIRTPMNGMLVMAELLAHAELPARSQRYAEVIWRSGQGLLAIINDILDFSKIEAGKLELEAVPVDVAEIAGTVIELFGEKARSKGLDLTSLVAFDVPRMVQADPVRLNQVLSNLVNNALKFTDQGGVILEITRDAVDDRRIRFGVTDTGIGIAPDKLGSVFGAFSQADQSTTRRFGGTGLGLAICRKLVEAMGSDIDLESTLDKGSTFSFAVAFPAVDDQTPTKRASPLAASHQVSIALQGRMTAKAIAYYFAQSGYDVVQEDHGKQLKGLGKDRVVIADAAACSSEAVGAARQQGCRVVALLDRGRDVPADLVVNAILPWPASRRDVEDLLAALAENRDLAEGATRRLQVRDRYVDVRALVADDNEVNREVASEALRRFGIEVDLVEDGEAAVRAATSKRYDVIFMDGSMPILDGFEATRQIRNIEREAKRSSTPIVALTAHVLGTSSTEWMDAGMDAILTKPFTLSALSKCLSEVLRSDQLRTSDDQDHEQPAEAPQRDDSLVDTKTLSELENMAQGGKTDFVRRVVGLYVDRAPGAVADIASHVNEGQLEAVAKSAHALKSMSLNIGAKRVALLASDIEAGAKAAALPNPDTLQNLASLIEQTCNALKGRLQV